MSAVLHCQNIERYLGDGDGRVHVLRGITLELQPGTVHAIVGPSGCGKSSLLYLLGLLDAPDAGSIEILGRRVSGLSEDGVSRIRNEKLGFVFQFHFLMPDFTAEENVMIPMRRLGKLRPDEMRARARMLLDKVGLEKKAGRFSNQLSGGEQQRVAIARALANSPAVLLADEPTGNLDTGNSDRVFALFKEIVHTEQKALLLVTHNPAIAEASDWVHEMKDGVIVQSHRTSEKRAGAGASKS
jgi:lipoprotein-releasing system ATP-binding protein